MNNEIRFDYYYGNESEQFSFYRIPRFLFTEDEFRKLSTESKVLYGLMLDRTGLSARNNWYDEHNRVYIIYTVDEAMEDLNCGNEKAIKLFKELSAIGLIERKNQGQGKPAKIYVKNFIKHIMPRFEKSDIESSEVGKSDVSKSEIGESDVKTSDNPNSRHRKNGCQDIGKSDGSYTNSNYTDFIYTNQSNQSYPEPEPEEEKTSTKKVTDRIDKIDLTNTYSRIIKNNLEYDIACQKYDKVKVDEIYELILETVCSPSETIRVNKADYPQEVVKSRLLKFDEEALEYVITIMKHNTKKVGNIRSYMLTTIFNAPITKDHYLTSEVNHAMYGN